MDVTPAAVLEGLRKHGYKVHVEHRRFVSARLAPDVDLVVGPLTRGEMYREGLPGWLIDPRGGQTTVIVGSPDGMKAWYGRAVCSAEDNFCRRTGLTIAVGRILEGAGFTLDLGSETQ